MAEERAFEMPFPPSGEKRLFPGVVAATAAVIRWRCEQLGALQEGGPTPVVDAMFSRNEPRTSVSGTLAWAVDVDNPATNEQFTLTLKEVMLPTPEGGSVHVADRADNDVERDLGFHEPTLRAGFPGAKSRGENGRAREKLCSIDKRIVDAGTSPANVAPCERNVADPPDDLARTCDSAAPRCERPDNGRSCAADDDADGS